MFVFNHHETFLLSSKALSYSILPSILLYSPLYSPLFSSLFSSILPSILLYSPLYPPLFFSLFYSILPSILLYSPLYSPLFFPLLPHQSFSLFSPLFYTSILSSRSLILLASSSRWITSGQWVDWNVDSNYNIEISRL